MEVVTDVRAFASGCASQIRATLERVKETKVGRQMGRYPSQRAKAERISYLQGLIFAYDRIADVHIKTK